MEQRRNKKILVSAVLKKLSGGDRRSIGKSDEVVALVLARPELFDAVFNGMCADDELLRMRCADVVEKVTAQRPEWLVPYKTRLFKQVARLEQQEVRWHVAQMFSRLALHKRERRLALQILQEFLTDKSGIVKTFSMQAMADIAARDEELRADVIAQLRQLTRTGTPAMRSRGKKVLAKLNVA